ncbi:hypothetical protein GW17_00033600 [Ensete ventricosum]|nr:hypothetical protein GW17_00033600 [Ensete ventricosum]
MGCVASKREDAVANKGRPGNIEEVAVFVPGLRAPKNVDFVQSLGDRLPKRLVEHLSTLRTKVVVMAAQETPTVVKPRRKTATQHVLHLMAMICFSEANLLLLPKVSGDGHHLKEYEESRRTSIDKFLKAAGYLDCAIRHVLPRLPPDLRNDLPVDLAEGVLRSLHMQALGQYKARFAISTFTARYGRYIPVRQVVGTWTARYRAILPKIDQQRSIKVEIGSIEGEKGKKKKRKRKKEEKKKT